MGQHSLVGPRVQALKNGKDPIQMERTQCDSLAMAAGLWLVCWAQP